MEYTINQHWKEVERNKSYKLWVLIMIAQLKVKTDIWL